MDELKTRFLESIRNTYPKTDAARVAEALAWAEDFHADRRRASGELLWVHALRVAEIVLGMGLDADSVVAALLHGCLANGGSLDARPVPPEKSRVSSTGFKKDGSGSGGELARIAERFGPNVALLVEDTARLAALKAKNKTVHAAETIRKMLFAMARDIRVIILKLADKLDSMRTLKFLDEELQKEIASECLDVFAPLADRLGISWLKDELEDLALKTLNREAFDQIKEIVSAKKTERELFLKRVEAELRAAAAAEGIAVEVTARAKHFYSIYQKMRKGAKSAEELYDLLGLRLICATESECYALLGMVHKLWKPIDGRFKDYIAMPKANGYRSLHTTVMCYEGRLLEVQIRTAEMHRVAEYGVASHWLYKKGKTAEAPRPEDLPIVNRLKEWSDFVSRGAVYLDEIKRELFKDSIFVFTPKGDVIELPAGSTPLDFAFAIHTDVGIHCLGAKADGQIVPLDAELQNTQVVEVLTSPQARPNINWLRIAKTSKARSKIRAYLVQDGQALAIDRNIVVGGRGPVSSTQAPQRQPASPQGQAGHAQAPLPPQARQGEAPRVTIEYRASAPGEAVRNDRAGVSVGGAKNLMIRIAGCCQPVTGDEIVGYISRGRGIIVHRADCRSIRSVADFAERRIEVSWESSASIVTARFRITSRKSQDLFSEIENAVHKFGGRLREGRLGERGDGNMSGSFIMEFESRDDVRRAVKAMRGMPSIISVDEDEASL
jgi:GTP pyrophosphokinase